MARSRAVQLAFACFGLATARDGNFLAPRPQDLDGNTSSTLGRQLQTLSGLYQGEIRWLGLPDTCMDVAGGSAEDGNKIQAWKCEHPNNQVFMYDPSEAMTQIKWAAQPHKCLDVLGGATEDGTPVVLWDCHDLYDDSRDHQAFFWTGSQFQWQLHPSKCLTLKDGLVGSSSQGDSKLVISDCRSTYDGDFDHQVWYMGPGTCLVKDATCGFYGQSAAQCCDSFRCASLPGTNESRCEDPNCVQNGALCGFRGRISKSCCLGQQCASVSGSLQMQCEPVPTPAPTPVPTSPPTLSPTAAPTVDPQQPQCILTDGLCGSDGEQFVTQRCCVGQCMAVSGSSQMRCSVDSASSAAPTAAPTFPPSLPLNPQQPQCASQSAVCGSNGVVYKRCCVGQCAAQTGSSQMRCESDSDPVDSPTAAPTELTPSQPSDPRQPQCASESAVCGSNGRMFKPCCVGQCSAVTGSSQMYCRRDGEPAEPVPNPTPAPMRVPGRRPGTASPTGAPAAPSDGEVPTPSPTSPTGTPRPRPGRFNPTDAPSPATGGRPSRATPAPTPMDMPGPSSGGRPERPGNDGSASNDSPDNGSGNADMPFNGRVPRNPSSDGNGNEGSPSSGRNPTNPWNSGSGNGRDPRNPSNGGNGNAGSEGRIGRTPTNPGNSGTVGEDANGTGKGSGNGKGRFGR